jgi:hypothetical protein
LKGANLHIAEELEFDGKLRAYGILMLLALVSSAGFAAVVLRKPKKQWVIRTYTGILFAWAIIFMAMAINAPSRAEKAATNIDD